MTVRWYGGLHCDSEVVRGRGMGVYSVTVSWSEVGVWGFTV